MEDSEESMMDVFLLPVNEKQVMVFRLPKQNKKIEMFLKCKDDSLPETFEPQEGHWIKKDEYYKLLGATQALNDSNTLSLALATKEGLELNPWGDDKRSYGISDKRFRQQLEFDHIIINKN
jgi:hypothetical protein